VSKLSISRKQKKEYGYFKGSTSKFSLPNLSRIQTLRRKMLVFVSKAETMQIQGIDDGGPSRERIRLVSVFNQK
jgi:hypothetical protein